MKNFWIKTCIGWAGRTGYIVPSNGEAGKFMKYTFKSYDGVTTEHSDKIGELKKFGNGGE